MAIEMINGELWFNVVGSKYHGLSLIFGMVGGMLLTLFSIWFAQWQDNRKEGK